MIITFCGHSEVTNKSELEDSVFAAITSAVTDEPVLFYLGGYGDFDAIALRACKRYKGSHPSARIVFVTPYLDERYLKNRAVCLTDCDEVIYPEIENVLPKYAICKRNKWMVQRADCLISYVDHSWGGAAKTFLYAVRKNKPYVNLGDYVSPGK